MVVSSGIVLPGDQPLSVKEVVSGLFVAVNAYECDTGYFSQSSLYTREQGQSKPASQSEPATAPTTPPSQ